MGMKMNELERNKLIADALSVYIRTCAERGMEFRKADARDVLREVLEEIEAEQKTANAGQ